MRALSQVLDMKAARKSSCEEPVEGAHMAAKAMAIEKWKPVVSTMPVMQATRIHFRMPKICMYKNKTEIFTKPSDTGPKTSVRRDSLLVSFAVVPTKLAQRVKDLPQAAFWYRNPAGHPKHVCHIHSRTHLEKRE